MTTHLNILGSIATASSKPSQIRTTKTLFRSTNGCPPILKPWPCHGGYHGLMATVARWGKVPQACMTLLSRVPCTWDYGLASLLLQLLDTLANNRKNNNWINLQLNWIINFLVLSELVLLLNLTVCFSFHVRKTPQNCPSYPKPKVPLSRQKNSWVRKQVWQVCQCLKGNFVETLEVPGTLQKTPSFVVNTYAIYDV